MYRYRAVNVPLPRLINRDLALIGGHAVSFTMVLATRASGATDASQQHPLMVLLESIPAILGLVVYVYFELFVIERGQ